MPTQLDIKRRIRSVKNTQQITRAMKFVAAARLRRAQEKAVSTRPYANAMRRLVASVASRAPEGSHPLLARREEKRTLLIVISGERGLAGAFNSNVIRRALEFLRGHESETLELMALGRKGRDTLRKQRWKILAEYVDITSKAERSKAVEIAKRLGEMYQSEEIDAVYIVFNEFKSVLTQTLRLEKLLPIEPASGSPEVTSGEGKNSKEAASAERGGASTQEKAATEPTVEYLFEDPPAELFGQLLPRYLEGQIFRALAESAAAEHAARMTAMDSATNNAGELIDKLTLYMNKVRQAAITKEIIEVVSGAASAGEN